MVENVLSKYLLRSEGVPFVIFCSSGESKTMGFCPKISFSDASDLFIVIFFRLSLLWLTIISFFFFSETKTPTKRAFGLFSSIVSCSRGVLKLLPNG